MFQCGEFPVVDKVYERLGDALTSQSSDHGYKIYYFVSVTYMVYSIYTLYLKPSVTCIASVTRILYTV